MTTTDPDVYDDWEDDHDVYDHDEYDQDEEFWDDFAGYDPHDPGPEDWEIARSYAEFAEHCDQVHGGGECNCRPPLADRARNAVRRARYAWARLTRRASDEPPF